MKIPEWLKTYRQERDLSQKQLARLLNCSVSSLSAWESGKREPSTVQMFSIVGHLGLPEHFEALDGRLESFHDGAGNGVIIIDESDR